MNKAKPKPALRTAPIIVALAIGLVVALLAVAKLWIDVRQFSDSYVSQVIKFEDDIGRLKTCYDNNLKPCNDETIRTYNSANGLYPQ